MYSSLAGTSHLATFHLAEIINGVYRTEEERESVGWVWDEYKGAFVICGVFSDLSSLVYESMHEELRA